MKEGIDVEMNDPRMENLRRAAGITRQQSQAIMNQLNSMNDEEVNLLLSENEELRDFISVDADKDNSGIVVNYTNQPQNGNTNQITFQAPWEGNLSVGGAMSPQTMNLFQSNGLFGNIWNWGQMDKRVQVYNQHPGMRLYNINPYQFLDENDLMNYYTTLEQQREKDENLKYVFCRLGAREDGSKEALEWAEQFKFKPADDIVKEQYEARQRAEEERRKELYGEDGTRTVYGVYDANGYRLQRACAFKVVNLATGEVVKEVKYRKDENGQSYEIHSMTEDRKLAYEIQQLHNAFYQDARFKEVFRRLFNQDYFGNIAKWEGWKQAGLTKAQMYTLYEDERVDWKKHEKLINRALMAASYSREKFNDILRKCCHCELDYANKSSFFSLSYDFERDLHYKRLTSTPEEMQNDPMVHSKLQQEYEIKRKLFMDKVNSGNLGCNMMMDANYHPTFPKPNIEQLTLEDFNKPENQVMYTQIVTPEIATPNMFIPDNKSNDKPLSREEILAMNGVKLDANGQVIPQQRTIGYMTVDDDTGQIISQQEFDVEVGHQGNSANNDMTDEELINAGF